MSNQVTTPLMHERVVSRPIHFVTVLGLKILHSCEHMTGRSNHQKKLTSNWKKKSYIPDSEQEKWIAKCSNETFPSHPTRVISRRNEVSAETIPPQQLFKSLSLFIGPQGLLRATGQTKQLAVSTFDSKHPILLDGRHPAVCLYWEQLHETHCHQGVNYLRTLVQQQFAIVKLRTALRSIVSECVTCRKRRAETLHPIVRPSTGKTGN